jgi:hypothetical protein
MTFLAHLEEVRTELQGPSVGAEEYILEAIYELSSRFVDSAGMEFEPLRAERSYRLGKRSRYGNAHLVIAGPLVEFESLSYGTTVLTSPDVTLADDIYPFSRATELEFASRCGISVGDRFKVLGTWVYRNNYAEEGWFTADALQEDIDATTETVKVLSATGGDYYGFTPWVSPGSLIRIDDEMMRVLAVDTTTPPHVLTVRRHARGSPATTHALSTPVRVWAVEPRVKRAIKRWVGMAVYRKGTYEQQAITDAGTKIYPADMPKEVENIIASFPDGVAI